MTTRPRTLRDACREWLAVAMAGSAALALVGLVVLLAARLARATGGFSGG